MALLSGFAGVYTEVSFQSTEFAPLLFGDAARVLKMNLYLESFQSQHSLNDSQTEFMSWLFSDYDNYLDWGCTEMSADWNPQLYGQKVLNWSVLLLFWQAIIKKRPSRNINVQNFWLYVFGMIFNALAIVTQDFDAVVNK